MAFDVAVSGHGKKGRAAPDMNVTPLVDVVLVLLIIFMVITPMMAKQFWVHVPPETPPPSAPSDAPPSAVIRVERDGTVRLNRELISESELSARVERVLAARGDRTLFFDADDAAPYGTSVRILDLLRGGGATTVVVMTEPLPSD